jgi:hypothetical protein
MFKRLIAAFILFTFFLSSVINPSLSHAQALGLPEPGVMVNLSAAYAPALLRGLVVSPNDPMKILSLIRVMTSWPERRLRQSLSAW